MTNNCNIWNHFVKCWFKRFKCNFRNILVLMFQPSDFYQGCLDALFLCKSCGKWSLTLIKCCITWDISTKTKPSVISTNESFYLTFWKFSKPFTKIPNVGLRLGQCHCKDQPFPTFLQPPKIALISLLLCSVALGKIGFSRLEKKYI